MLGPTYQMCHHKKYLKSLVGIIKDHPIDVANEVRQRIYIGNHKFI